MERFKIAVSVVGVCVLFSVGGFSQVVRPRGRSVDLTSRIATSVEPESPAISSTVATSSHAVVPRLMKFSGVLRDAAGKPLTGTVDVTFALYSTEAGGNPLWFETQSVQADELGRYTALLGAMHTEGLPINLFTSGEVGWLGIQVGLEAEQQPRVLLVSVPYALKAGDAETLGGKPASAFVQTTASEETSATTTSATGTAGTPKKANAKSTGPQPNVAGTGNTNFLAKWTDNVGTLGNSVMFDTGTNVGVGTSSPGFKLEVVDTSGRAYFHLSRGEASGNGSADLLLGNQNLWQVGTDFGQNGSNDFFVYRTGSAPYMYFNSSGNVGIGTATPSFKFEIRDTSSDRARLKLSRGEASGNGSADLMLGNLNPWQIATDWEENGSNDFFVYRSGSTPSIFFNASGNVGIGTTAPAAKLEVNGTAKFDGAVSYASSQSSLGAVTIATPAATGSPAAALSVQATDLNTANFGVYSTTSGAGGTGVYGEADNGATAFGVWGRSTSGDAGHFDGNVHVVGALSKSSGSFKIDHPLDPANKYLYHSFVESPDMKNIYDGVVTLDAQGEAVVQLPDWFEALNRDFRYQLTCIGGYAPVYIADEIAQNQFRIAGGKPGLKISWQVTGVRQDAWANAHRIPVEEAKPAQERGFYLHPELFGAPEVKGMSWASHPEQMRQRSVPPSTPK